MTYIKVFIRNTLGIENIETVDVCALNTTPKNQRGFKGQGEALFKVLDATVLLKKVRTQKLLKKVEIN